MKTTIINQEQCHNLVHKLIREITSSQWRPDYIVGINPGGLYPALLISQYLNVPLKTLEVNLKTGSTVCDCGMAEDAFGPSESDRFVEEDAGAVSEAASNLLGDGDINTNILLVKDINESGDTFNWILNDWPSLCFPNDPRWQNVWNNNVRFAVLLDNLSSNCKVEMDYAGLEINKNENPQQVIFHWEHWWE
jgi:hypoxanthine phosphoribosyltransferase